jgi:D-xylose transport system ATP-binding protein
MEPLLEMNGITKRFPGVMALHNVCLTAFHGEILAIVGENGAGKSTLMKILSGSYSCESYEGEIRMQGSPMRFTTPHDAEKQGIAMIYQEINTLLDLSVTENLFLGHWQKKRSGAIDWSAMHLAASQMLEQIDLCIDPRQRMCTLNTSQQQLVCIASALSAKPKLLVLDEPTSALTESESNTLFRIMHRLKDQNITSILISHKLDEVFAHADRVTVMRDGEVIRTYVRESDPSIGMVTKNIPDKVQGMPVVEGFDRNQVITDMVGRTITNFYPVSRANIGKTALRIEGFTVPHPYNPGKHIVDDVSLHVNQGEILGLAGLVGAGRSELVNALFGITRRTKGNIAVFDSEVTVRNPSDAIAAGIALITEDRKKDGYVPLMNIHENITLSSLRKISRRGNIDRKLELTQAGIFFSKLGIRAPGLKSPLYALSGGNQQKVVLSKWLMTEPRILIMDEPTRGIDVGAKTEIYEIMRQLTAEGLAVIMISSELPELLSMSDRIAVLSAGRLSGIVQGSQATQEEVMHLATRFMIDSPTKCE